MLVKLRTTVVKEEVVDVASIDEAERRRINAETDAKDDFHRGERVTVEIELIPCPVTDGHAPCLDVAGHVGMHRFTEETAPLGKEPE